MTIANLATATPVEIDTELGRLAAEAAPFRQTRDSVQEKLLHLTRGTEGDKPVEIRTYRDAEDRARKLVTELPMLLARLDAAREAIAPIAAAEKPLDAEYEARGGWSRFFLVTSSDGHVHSSTHCSTCNPRTQFAWMPDLSGLTMAEAIAVMDKRGSAEVLCTVCFPDAPVARTIAQVPDTQCPGSGTWDYPRETARLGYYTGNFGICRHCGQPITVSSTGKMRKHDKTAAKPKPNENAPTASGESLTVKDAYGHRESLNTERAATSWAVRAIGTHREYNYDLPTEAIETITKALAEKHGKTVDEITAELEAKVTAWIKREKRR